MAVSDTAMLHRNEEYVQTDLDNELIVMQVASGSIYGMEDVAKEIWRALETPISFGALIDRLQSAYDVDRRECAEDVSQFLEALNQGELIAIGERAGE